MALVGTVAAGPAVTTTLKTNFAPQFFVFEVGTIPTNVKVNIDNTGVTYDLGAAGLRTLQAAFGYSKNPNVYVVPIATGYVAGKNVSISITNADAAAFDLYTDSNQYAKEGIDLAYFQAITQNVNANSGTLIEKFAFLGLPNAGASDSITINYVNGFQENAYRQNLECMHHLKSADDLATASGNYLINNLDRTIRSVNFTPSTQQDIFVFRYAPAVAVNTVA